MHVASRRREETYKLGSQVGISFFFFFGGGGLYLFFIAVCGLSLVVASRVEKDIATHPSILA